MPQRLALLRAVCRLPLSARWKNVADPQVVKVLSKGPDDVLEMLLNLAVGESEHSLAACAGRGVNYDARFRKAQSEANSTAASSVATLLRQRRHGATVGKTNGGGALWWSFSLWLSVALQPLSGPVALRSCVRAWWQLSAWWLNG